MSTKQTHSIRLLNRSYNIRCHENEAEELQQAAHRLNAYMLEYKNQFKTIDDHQTLILAALKISHELNKTHESQEARQEQLSQFISKLEQKVSQVSEKNKDTITD